MARRHCFRVPSPWCRAMRCSVTDAGIPGTAGLHDVSDACSRRSTSPRHMSQRCRSGTPRSPSRSSAGWCHCWPIPTKCSANSDGCFALVGAWRSPTCGQRPPNRSRNNPTPSGRSKTPALSPNATPCTPNTGQSLTWRQDAGRRLRCRSQTRSWLDTPTTLATRAGATTSIISTRSSVPAEWFLGLLLG